MTGAGAGEGRRGAAVETRLRRTLGRADLRAVPASRRAVRELLRRSGRSGPTDTAELLTSELVTNALVHTDHEAVLTATVGPDGLRVEVRDFVPGRPRPRRTGGDESTSGRGLLLVESLADAWGVRAHGSGKAVWFRLEARTDTEDDTGIEDDTDTEADAA
ncbi:MULTISPECIES: ATP-binding protein [unclassified Streptomyces]|uniref:ATP-binding protein n=1 Tax=unclassified Streptomyces TaxID=2593676 RepID=UPI003828FB92